jgi:hypothetical protein
MVRNFTPYFRKRLCKTCKNYYLTETKAGIVCIKCHLLNIIKRWEKKYTAEEREIFRDVIKNIKLEVMQ